MAALKALVVAAGVAVASRGLAQAADLLPPAPTLPPPAPEGFGGWYLRGDVGFGVAAARPNLQNEPDPVATGVSSGFLSPYASESFNNTTLSSSGMFDFGVGYRFNNWFRVDGTVEYRGGANLESLYTLTDAASPAFGGALQYADFYRADVSSIVGLVNGYVDLGTYWGMTPFVGAGLGFADNMVSGFTDQGFGYSIFGPLGLSGGYFSNGSKTNFAWALMAGLDFDVTPNLRLEVGYRYLNYGSVTTGGSNCLAGALGGAFNAANCNGGVANYVSSRNMLGSNDFRIGLIWMLGEPAARPAPVVARY
jgi:opacity protein-like surface antigen